MAKTAAHRKSRIAKYNRRWYAAHRIEILGKRRTARAANPESAREYVRNHRASNPRVYAESAWRGRGIAITWEQYQDMLTAQGGLCFWCGGGATGRNKKLSVDHDHQTGIARGLLCAWCNRARISDWTVESAERLVEYLKRGRK